MVTKESALNASKFHYHRKKASNISPLLVVAFNGILFTRSSDIKRDWKCLFFLIYSTSHDSTAMTQNSALQLFIVWVVTKNKLLQVTSVAFEQLWQAWAWWRELSRVESVFHSWQNVRHKTNESFEFFLLSKANKWATPDKNAFYISKDEKGPEKAWEIVSGVYLNNIKFPLFKMFISWKAFYNHKTLIPFSIFLLIFMMFSWTIKGPFVKSVKTVDRLSLAPFSLHPDAKKSWEGD